MTVSPSPQFCFGVPTNASPEYLLGFVDVKGDIRQIEFSVYDQGPEKWIPPKRQKPITATRAGDSWILVTVPDPFAGGAVRYRHIGDDEVRFRSAVGP